MAGDVPSSPWRRSPLLGRVLTGDARSGRREPHPRPPPRVRPGPAGRGRASSSRIVEERDARPSERAITEVNSGVYFLRTPRSLCPPRDPRDGQRSGRVLPHRRVRAPRRTRVSGAAVPGLGSGAMAGGQLARRNSPVLRQRLRREVVERLDGPGGHRPRPRFGLGRAIGPARAGGGPPSLCPPLRRDRPHGVLRGGSHSRFSTATYLGPGTSVKEHCVLEGRPGRRRMRPRALLPHAGGHRPRRPCAPGQFRGDEEGRPAATA